MIWWLISEIRCNHFYVVSVISRQNVHVQVLTLLACLFVYVFVYFYELTSSLKYIFSDAMADADMSNFALSEMSGTAVLWASYPQSFVTRSTAFFTHVSLLFDIFLFRPLQWCYMGVIASQITRTSTACSADWSRRKPQNIAYLVLSEGNPSITSGFRHRELSLVMRRTFPSHDVIMKKVAHNRYLLQWKRLIVKHLSNVILCDPIDDNQGWCQACAQPMRDVVTG